MQGKFRPLLVQQLLLGVLTPILEARFSPSSIGFRPGRSQHDAVRAAQKHIQEGKTYVVDMDIEKFFDRVSHEESISHWIESRLRLKVNESKSGSGGVKGRKFLGESAATTGNAGITRRDATRSL
jgi:retron-type reverse transcriptase